MVLLDRIYPTCYDGLLPSNDRTGGHPPPPVLAAATAPAAQREASPLRTPTSKQSSQEQPKPTSPDHTILETMPTAPPGNSTSQSGARINNIGSRSTDTSSSSTDTSTENEVEYLGTQKPVLEHDDSDTSEEDAKPCAVINQTYLPNTSVTRDEEGFTPVLTRANRRRKMSQTQSTTVPHERTRPSTQISRKTLNSNPPHPPATSPPAEIQLPLQNERYQSNMDEHPNIPVQLDTLTEILQERLHEMTNHIERREQQLVDKIHSAEDHLYKKERKTATERHNHRQYIERTMKRLEEWEENLLLREQTFERHSSNMHAQYERYTRKYEDLQQQAERAITAWQEVTQATLKEKIDLQLKEQTQKIADFATNQEQQLMSLFIQ